MHPRPQLLFLHPRPHFGGGVGVAIPQLICPLIAIGLRNKGKWKASDVLIQPTIPIFPTLGHILTFPGRV